MTTIYENENKIYIKRGQLINYLYKRFYDYGGRGKEEEEYKNIAVGIILSAIDDGSEAYENIFLMENEKGLFTNGLAQGYIKSKYIDWSDANHICYCFENDEEYFSEEEEDEEEE